MTGSCKAGRDAFVKDVGADLNSGTYTVAEFIALTKNAYGGETIKKLEREIKGDSE